MLDFAGREIQVGDTLAISPSRVPYLYKATVLEMEDYKRNEWIGGEIRAVQEITRKRLTLRLESNGRKQVMTEGDLYGRAVIISR